jgi:hypothetical protein
MIRLSTVAALFSTFVVLGLPTTAQAHRKPPKHHKRSVATKTVPLVAAEALAKHYWRTTPCDGQITIAVEPKPSNDADNPYDIETSMWASWTSSAGENIESGPLPFSACHVGINSAVWKSTTQEGYEMWPEFSIDLVHEFGHLLGYPDLFDPQDSGSIMYLQPSADVAFTGEYAQGWGY